MTLLRLLPVTTRPVCAWARWQARRVAAGGAALSPSERLIAHAVGVREPGRVRIAVVPAIPFPCRGLLDTLARWAGLPGPGSTDGLTLGHAIYLRADAADQPALLAHELRHVQQCEQLGSLHAFMQRYLQEVAEHGYLDAPLEVDARRAARAWALAQAGGANGPAASPHSLAP